MKNNLFPIAKDGWKYLAYAVVGCIIFSLLDLELFQFLSIIVILFFLFIFRNPERELPSFEENQVLSPVDGEVLSIDSLDASDTYAYKIVINTTYKDVGILRAPMNASIESLKKNHGTRLSLDNPLAYKINENVSIVFQDTKNNTIKLIHILKQSLCGVNVDLETENKVVQSARYGLMINGITEIYLPKNFRISLILGEEIIASKSLIGYFS